MEIIWQRLVVKESILHALFSPYDNLKIVCKTYFLR